MGRIFINYLVLLLGIIVTVQAQQCPYEFEPAKQCFDPDTFKEYAPIAKSMETLYNKYVNLLTDAKFTIDGDEAGVDYFFGGELTEAVRKLKYDGNSIITFLEIVLRDICKEGEMDANQMLHCFESMNITGEYFKICDMPATPVCSQYIQYQPIDGRCVNHKYPLKGAVNTPYSRIMKNTFDDSIHEIRTSARDNDLPSARLLSTGLRTLYIPAFYESNEDLPNDMLMIFFQTVILDVSKTLNAQTWNGNYGFECCDCKGGEKLSPRFSNHHCLPIEIPEKDPYFKETKCMNYIRAMVTHDHCKLEGASVLNTATHFLDLDIIYVPENVKIAIKNGGKFPDSRNGLHRATLYGDERTLDSPHLAAIAIVFIKFHNIVVQELSRLYPTLSAEIKFYEARRFVINLYQSIIYNELLPIFLSANAMSEYNLSGKEKCYDPEVDPSVTVEFVASAARYLNIYIQNGYYVNLRNGTRVYYKLRDLNTDWAFDEFGGVLIGLLDTPWNSADIAEEPSNFLFTKDGEVGLDLRALDLQTERDFGIATYCDALYYFNITHGYCIESFTDLGYYTSKEHIEFLKYAYEDPCDVDLGVGASLHNLEEGNTLNEIFDRIIAMQFENLKCGDSYFYTNALMKDQIEIVSQYTFGDILCLVDPSFNAIQIQPFVFLTPGANNTKAHCTTTLDLTNWKLSIDPTKITKMPSTTETPTTKFVAPTDEVADLNVSRKP